MTSHELPAVRHARQETWWTLAAWLVALVYTIGYCARYGYGRDLADLTFVWGVPDWVFWGIFVPWGVSTLFSIWFAFGRMRRDDLGVEQDDALSELMEME